MRDLCPAKLIRNVFHYLHGQLTKHAFLGVMGKVRRTDMKASEIKEKMSKISKNDISSFFQKNWKYFTAVILFVVLAVVMIKFSSGNKDKDNGLSTEQSTESESFQVDAVPEINTLMQNYYNAYAAGDLATLQTYATPVSENEQSLITMMSQYAESYQNIKCYTKSGLEADSYLVCVTLDLKFAGVDTTAPGMEFFYVKKNEQGALYTAALTVIIKNSRPIIMWKT